VFEEHRCKRFDVGEPLASPLSACVERLSVCVERRWKRFDAENVRASGLSECRERPSVLE
jgi:hypothetical protein